MTTTRPPYSGPRRKLVLAFDVGTKYSGISYSILCPGEVPAIERVTRFPSHEQIGGDSKIPTVIYYDQAGNIRAAGAETTCEGILERAEDEGWVKSEWFKLHFGHITQNIPPLPPGKTAVQVLADFLQYLHQCAEAYIKDTHANGRDLWDSVASGTDYVLSHPNGWDGDQQSKIRDAVVLAGLVSNTTNGHARISFVSEGEAGLHFAIDNGLPPGASQAGDGISVVEAGEGTIEFSAYSRKMPHLQTTGLFEEIAAPLCHFHGSIFVSVHARMFLKVFLEDSEYFDDLDHIMSCFDKTTKVRFSSDKELQYVKFGSTRDNDAAHNIRFGQIKLEGSHVASFFEPSIKCIVESVQAQNGHHPIKYVVLLGSFSNNPWLYSKVSEALHREGIQVFRPDLQTASDLYTSDGAISFYLSQLAARNWERDILRAKERMEEELSAVKAELDLKKLECSDTMRLLEQAQQELRDVKEALRKSREEIWTLGAENKALLDEMNGVKEAQALARDQFQIPGAGRPGN